VFLILPLLPFLAMPAPPVTGDEAHIESLVEGVRFRDVEFASVEERKVYAILTRGDLWREAFRTVEREIGPFKSGMTIDADFEYAGEELAKAAGLEEYGVIHFNIKKIAGIQRRIDELEAEKRELEKQGLTIRFRIPPVRIDRIVHHELVHVRQRGLKAPLWYSEGMAVLVGQDPNPLFALLDQGLEIKLLDEVESKGLGPYARGHLFWKWLSHQGWARRTIELSVVERRDWKEALREVSGFAWKDLVVLEREWSLSEAARLRAQIAR
jgi:hypothetical protein